MARCFEGFISILQCSREALRINGYSVCEERRRLRLRNGAEVRFVMSTLGRRDDHVETLSTYNGAVVPCNPPKCLHPDPCHTRLRVVAGSRRVLMIHRNARPGDQHLGKYNGLGGKLEADEDIVAGMRREIHEEAGID
jgi:hypothetical protein